MNKNNALFKTLMHVGDRNKHTKITRLLNVVKLWRIRFLKLLQEKAALDKKALQTAFVTYVSGKIFTIISESRVHEIQNSNLFRSSSVVLQVLSAYRVFSQHISGYEFALQNAINYISWGLTFELYNN